MKEVLVLIAFAAITPLLIFPTMRLAYAPRAKRSRRKMLSLKLLVLAVAALAVVAAVFAFRCVGVTGNGVLVVCVLYAYGVYVLARQRYAS